MGQDSAAKVARSKRQAPVIGWKVLSFTPDMASVRYRALYPALGLLPRGYESVFLQEGEALAPFPGLAAVVFVKTFSRSDLQLATELRRAGVQVILDLCDDVFVDGYGKAPAVEAFACFDDLAQLAAAVVTPTAELANRLRERVASRVPVVVIPDQLETQGAVRGVERLGDLFFDYRRRVIYRRLSRLPRSISMPLALALRGALRVVDPKGRRAQLSLGLRSLRERLRHPLRRQGSDDPIGMRPRMESDSHNSNSLKRLIWFGNHGAPHSAFGLSSLAEIVPHLAEVNRAIPLELIVVSNNRSRFDAMFSDVPFRIQYREWNLSTFVSHIRDADVCVLPNPRDRFSIAKSANRAVLSLGLGVPVVASSIPSLDDFRDCVILDDWVEGISTYLTDRDRAARDVVAARRIIADRYSSDAVADSWQRLVEAVVQGREIAASEIAPPPSSRRTNRSGLALATRNRSGRPVLSVALCTYNGAKHIREQLISLANQSRAPDELIVCDDGSTDRTLDLVHAFAASAPFEVRITANQKTLGVVRNFEQAVRLCEGGYVALADQDDVWETGKLQATLETLRSAEALAGSATPVLVHTDLRVIDESGRSVDDSYFRRRGFRLSHPEPLRELVAQNYVTGCSVMVNRATLELALPIPSQASVHDWWLALVAAGAGKVVTVDQPTAGYRQHSLNVVGAKPRNWRPSLLPDKARRRFTVAVGQSMALEARLRERRPGSAQLGFLSEYHRLLSQGGVRAAKWLISEKICFQTWPQTLAFLAHVTAGSLRPPAQTELTAHVRIKT